MAIDIGADYVEATVTNGGTTASGGDTALTVTTSENWPVLTASQQMRVMDKAQLTLSAGYEIMLLTANSNGSSVAWTVTRGVEGSTTTTHAPNWTIVPVETVAGLLNMLATALDPVPVQTSSFSPAANQFVPVDTTSASVNIPLPHAPVDKSRIGIKVINGGTTGASLTHYCTFTAQGGDVFNKAGGASVGTLYLLNQGVTLQYYAAAAIWYVPADDLPLPQLQALFGSGGGSGGSVTVRNVAASGNFAAGDIGNIVAVNSASSVTLTWVHGTAAGAAPILVLNLGTGGVTVVGDGSTTVNGVVGGSVAQAAQYGSIALTQYATDTFDAQVGANFSATSTTTLTNKRITRRVLALSANSATPAINTDNYDVVHITAQTAAITSFTSGLTGTPVDGDTLRISVTGTAAVALTFGTSFEASGGQALSTTTVTTARLDMGFVWNTESSKWRQIAAA